MRLGLNVGAGSFWEEKPRVYRYKSKGTVIRKDLQPEDQMSLLSAIAEQYRIWYMEDPFHPGDVMSHAQLTQKLPDTVIAGCELYGSDLERMKGGAKLMATKALTVYPGSLRTVSHLNEIANLARARGLKLVLSRGPRETEDAWISDLSVAFGADMLKLSIVGSENTSKFNRLMEIWDDAPSPSMGLSGPGEAIPEQSPRRSSAGTPRTLS